MAIALIVEANAAGARLVSACFELGISLRTLKRWRRAFGGDGDGEDRRKGSSRLVSHRLRRPWKTQAIRAKIPV